MRTTAIAAPGRPTAARRLVAGAVSTALTSVALIGIAAPSVSAATVLSTSWAGTNNTAMVGEVLYAKSGGRVTLTVQTTPDTRCVQMTGAHTGRQTASGPTSTWSFTVVAGTGEGARSLTLTAAPSFNSTGCAGVSGAGQATYVVDNTGPVATATTSPEPNAAGWNNTETSVLWTATDAGAGVPAQPYETDLVTADGIHLVSTTGGLDRLGNLGPGASTTVRVDRTAPVLTASKRWAADGSGVTVVFGCLDPGVTASGIDTCLADGSTTNARTVAQGETVTGTSRDVAGNTATLDVDTTEVDTTPPVLSGAPTTQPQGEQNWYRGDVPVHWTASDPESGIAEAPADTVITGEGEGLTSSATATNGAGLSTTATSAPPVGIDRTPPATTLSGAPEGWTSEAVTLALSATDNLSGVASTTYRIDGGAAQSGDEVVLTEDGDHTISFSSTDVAGNDEPAQTARVRVDRTAPTIGHLFTPDAYENGAWTNADTVTVTFVCDDRGGSGLASCTAPTGVTAEGVQSVTGTATDGAGNHATDRATVRIDRTAPQVEGTVVGVRNEAGWYSDAVRVTWAGTDALSGVSTISPPTEIGEGLDQSATGTATDAAGNRGGGQVTGVDVDLTDPVLTAAFADAWSTDDVPVDWSCTDALSGVATGPADGLVAGEGADLTTTASCTDEAGNAVTETVHGIRIDRTPPVTRAEAVGSEAAGWYPGAVTARLAATDALSGVRTTTYTVDGGEPRAYTGAFEVTGSGEHTVSFWSTDVAGNVEGAGAPLSVRIDAEAPVTELVDAPAADGRWLVTSGVPFAFRATDAGSGVAATYYSVDGGTAQLYGEPFTANLATGEHTVRYWSVDVAGNVEDARSFTVRIDTEGPVVVATVVDGARGSAGWYVGPVTVDFTCTDAVSGVATCPAPQSFDADGVHTATGTATDRAGNSTTATAAGIRIDSQRPVTELVEPVATDAWVTSGGVPVAFRATDAGSGVAATYYSVDGGAAQAYAGPFTAPLGGGEHTVRYWSADVAGNVEDARSFTVRVDADGPVLVAAVVDGATGSAGWYVGPVTVDFTCTDVLSGVATCPSPQSFGTDGVHTAVGTATDRAGNRTTASVQGIRIDATAPTARFGAQLGTVSTGAVPAAPTCTAVDAGSGPGSCTVTGYSTAVGTHTLTATATDVAGNTGTATQTYTVAAPTLSVRGFYSPIDMNRLNVVKGGSTVPVKFELFDGRRELTSTSDVTSVTSRQVSCTTGAAFAPARAVVSTGGTALRYTGQFIQNWKVPTALGCYELTMTARDGSTIEAQFKVK